MCVREREGVCLCVRACLCVGERMCVRWCGCVEDVGLFVCGSMYLCMYVCVSGRECVCDGVGVWKMWVYLSLCLWVYVSMCVCRGESVCAMVWVCGTCGSICLCVCGSMYLCMCVGERMCVRWCGSICLWVYVSMYLCMCVYVYICACVCEYCSTLQHTATHCNTPVSVNTAGALLAQPRHKLAPPRLPACALLFFPPP